MESVADCLPSECSGYTYRAYGLLLRAASRAGYSRGGYGDVGSRGATCALGHLLYNGNADRAEGFKRVGFHAEQLFLYIIAV